MSRCLLLLMLLSLSALGSDLPEGISPPPGNFRASKAFRLISERAGQAVKRLGLPAEDARCAWAMAALFAARELRAMAWDSRDVMTKVWRQSLNADDFAGAEKAMSEGHRADGRGDRVWLNETWLEEAVKKHCGPPSSPTSKRVVSGLWRLAMDKAAKRREAWDSAMRAEPEKFVDGKFYVPSPEAVTLVMGGLLAPCLVPYLSLIVDRKHFAEASAAALP